jgi:hypothetical protein
VNTATNLHIIPTAEVVEQKETALAVIPESKVTDIFLKGEGIDELLDACEKKAMAVTTDVSTAKGRAEIKSMAYLVARTKTAFDVPGKALSAEYKEKPKIIDGNRKRVSDFLEDLQARVRRPLTEWEEAEKARVQGIKDRITVIQQYVPMAASAESSEAISDMINNVASVEVDDHFAEFQAEAKATRDATLVKLYAALDAAMKREAEAAELARLRAEAAKRAQEDRDRKIAEAAAEKAKRDAEEAAARERAEAERKAKEEREAAERRELELKLAAEKAERERLEAIERAEREKQAAIDAERRKQEEAERARLAEEARIKAEEKRRAEDLAHRESIHKAILGALKDNGIPASHAASVVSLLSTSSIPFVIVEY